MDARRAEKLAAFDEDEWARVERAYADRLVAYVARRVPDVETRDDVVQEVFLGAVRGIANFDERFTFEQYLFGICRNRTIDQMRRRRFVGTGADADSEDDPGALRIEDLASGDESTGSCGEPTSRVVVESCSRRHWPGGSRTRGLPGSSRDSWWSKPSSEEAGGTATPGSDSASRDETAVAGIKFRALKRLRELVARDDTSGDIVPSLSAARRGR